MQGEYERGVVGARTPVAPEPEARTRSAVADWLNRCLRTELSAVETYDLAVRQIGRGELSDVLRQIRASHEQRAIILREHLLAMGHSPSESSGVWGAFAKGVQAGADLLGARAAVAALEQFEDHAESIYAEQGIPIDEGTLAMLAVYILPEQRRTSDLSHTLLHFVESH